MKAATMLAVLSLVVGQEALAETHDNKPTVVSIRTPENWVHQTLSNGMDQYLPLEIAKQGRPGAVNCNVLTRRANICHL